MNKEIIHIETGKRGKIITKMKGKPGSFPDQLLIYWYDGKDGSEHAENNRTWFVTLLDG